MRSFREPSQIEVFEGPGAWRRLLLKAHGRVLETRTARTFPTRQQPSRRWPVLNVTLAHAKIGCAVLVVGIAPIVVVCALRRRTMEAGMRSEQVYWVFTVTVDQMDKFTPLKEPGALQFECNIGNDQEDG
jgi:hypothetical protein